MDQFDIDGTVTDGTLKAHWRSSGYSGSDGSNPACDVDASISNPTLLSHWRAGKTASHYIVGERADGYGRDFVTRCGVGSTIQNAGGYSPLFANTGVRADSASYLNGTNGAIFDRVMPVMNYSRSSTSHGDVADHIYDAQTQPGLTYPVKVNKAIPGSIASGKPLSRLYEKWDATAAAQRQKNETAKNNACILIRPNPLNSLDCDEYPFGSTWEGAGAGNNNFSVRYLDASQNRSAGGSLAVWYGADRILHKDKFYVNINP